MRSVRIWFSKTGKLKYISHLDTMRCFTRAFRRTNIPLWYTEGFNPKPYLNFLLPLPLGVEADREPLDVKIDDDFALLSVKEALNETLPAGFSVSDVTEPLRSKTEIGFAEYLIVYDDVSSQEAETLLTCADLICEKTGKVKGRKTVKTLQINEYIGAYQVLEHDGYTSLKITLPAGDRMNLTPINLNDAFSRSLSHEILPVSMRRLQILDTQKHIFL